MKRTLAIVVSLAVVVGVVATVYAQRTRVAEAVLWRELASAADAQKLASTEAQIINGPLAANVASNYNEIGSIRLANGDTWRFAFRSHHLIGGADSFSVFTGPTGTFRVRGDYFCCEVQIPPEAVSKDSTAFIAFLRRVHPAFELAP